MRLTRLLLPFLLTPLAVYAQTFEDIASVRLSEQTISQRGAAMGNISLDDPSLNPTALAKIEQPRFSIGLSRAEFDRFNGAITAESHSALNLSHVSAAIPAGNFTFSGHYKASPEINSALAIREGGTAPYTPVDCPPQTCFAVLFYPESMFERSEKRYGAAVAWHRGALAIGAGAEVVDLNEASVFGRGYAIDNGGSIPTMLPFELHVQRVEGREIVPSVAVRYDVSPRAIVAVAYNGAADFAQTTEACRGTDTFPMECATQYERVFSDTRKTADSLRASVAVDPVENITVAAEVVRHNHSNLGRNEIDGVPTVNFYRDATSVHIGGEFRLDRLSLRAGWWRDPSRRGTFAYDPIVRANPDHDHVTVGAGFTVGPARIDVALDDAETPSMRRASLGLTFGAR